ncbi:ABC transporter ATP-binding protein [Rhodococcus sp. ACPA4]|uniref:ABC transporter ATP-binding protein n=1 Tax=Rhodococcus sp. ACPA4 TaxID=2028571 RepID=UPI000BB12F9C|nr:ABC transporter ATP-binding protein [Rhodococcus sp. ACPA4]PBC35973.1 ABC transporter ATP-binding protein [Rhodococcus sp. ACPA4]
MSEAIVSTHRLSAGYDQVPVIHDLEIDTHAGEVVVLLGSNGAGKTTTLNAIAGGLKPSGGHVSWLGRPTKMSVYRRAAAGIRSVPESKAIFPSMSVVDNLDIGVGADKERALELFPELVPILGRRAGLLSGGEQQMLVVARALSCRPKLLLADEVSLGLAPMIVKRLLTAIRRAADEEGLAVLLVEQHLRAALAIADRGYVLQRGHVVISGSADELLERIDEIEGAYLTN